MEAKAFCPAHITGFFTAHLDDSQLVSENLGSTGAGFSIKHGVTTSVRVEERRGQESNFKITTIGYESDKTDVSEFVVNEFLQMGDFTDRFFDIRHEITIPVGYGLGSSGASALSLSYALDKALQTKLDKTRVGEIAHNAEVNCKTGLGDVLAAYHGGFEIRIKPGAPGIGSVEQISTEEISTVMICFSPVSTNRFIKERLSQINGLGGKMVGRLLESRDYEYFQDMSLEFARYVGVVTPKMQRLVNELSENNIKCGIALFGETVFTMIPKSKEDAVLAILSRYPDGTIIKSELDNIGARVLNN